MAYRETVDYLYGLERFGMKLGLDTIRTLLERLGNPQDAWRSLHVAGTHGKGSVCAFLEAALREAGHRVGLYTSPHLVRFNERIRVDGREISDAEVVRLTEEIRPHAEAMAAARQAMQPTFFEFTTALACRYFRDRNVDLAVLEVGMGGRLDATNVVQPEVAVITRLDLEHTQHLGHTLERIAAEKAGIIKPGVPVWTVDQPALPVLRTVAAQADAPLAVVGQDLHVTRTSWNLAGQELHVENGRRQTLHIPLLGGYQTENAALAYGALTTLQEGGWHLPRGALTRGFRTTRWPARLELLHHRPTILLDATHTVEGAARLREALDALFPSRRVLLVLGILNDKDLAGMATHLRPRSDVVIATQPETPRALPAEAVAAAFPASSAQVVRPVAQAVERALALAEVDDVVLITGSLYTAGEASGTVAAWRRHRGERVVQRLKAQYLPGDFAGAPLETALGKITRETEDPFVVLISTVLSQRTADPVTEAISSKLFQAYPTPEALRDAPLEAIETLIRPVNFYRTKARAIQAIARQVLEEFDGEVPADLDQLLHLPLVGRKTANCVLAYGYGRPAIPVDVHCHRIPNRIGLIATATPRETEDALQELLPENLWVELNELFVRHGQTTCHPRRPDCPTCTLADLCAYNLGGEAEGAT